MYTYIYKYIFTSNPSKAPPGARPLRSLEPNTPYRKKPKGDTAIMGGGVSWGKCESLGGIQEHC